MTDQPGWYPPGQVCYPPELPVYLKNVYDLKSIVGVPSNEDVIGIHAVIQAANRVSGVPGMHDPSLLMGLADHLFSAQMAKYRSKYSLITFPSDATYTPPELPAHVSVKLEPVSGAPSDDDMMRAQEALRSYQQFSHAPSMFDAHVNMELSQYLFDIQMARYMRLAGESQSIPVPQTTARPEAPARVVNQTQDTTGPVDATNNVGSGAKDVGIHHAGQSLPGIDVRELMERSNQLAERFNQLLERSNELAERSNQPGSHTFAEPFNQVLERLTQLVEKSHQPAERSDQLAERFNQLFERFNQFMDQSSQNITKANELADTANQLAGQLNESSERSNQLSKQANKSRERLGDVLGNINKVLVRIQHAIVRNHKGNTISALDCLVNERGETPPLFCDVPTLQWLSDNFLAQSDWRTEAMIDGAAQNIYIPEAWLGEYLDLYGIGKELCESETTTKLRKGKEKDARVRLSQYLSSCLG